MTDHAAPQEPSADNDKVMTLAEFNRVKKGKPINAGDAKKEMQKVNVSIVAMFKTGKGYTVLLDRPQAEAALQKIEAIRERLTPKAWTPPTRMATTESVETDLREIKTMLQQLLERS